jgi:uncharacterized protein (TIGR02001 family)
MHSGTFLKTFAAAALATTTLATAGVGAASAADNSAPAWNLLFGIGVTSDYIARGYRQSTGAAVQPWAELDIGPVYLGYWGSNVSPSLLGGAHWESDLSIGVRGAHGPIS